jgi:hypothetical protein
MFLEKTYWIYYTRSTDVLGVMDIRIEGALEKSKTNKKW